MDILADFEEGKEYPHFRLFEEGSGLTPPDPSEITLGLLNMGPGTTGEDRMGCYPSPAPLCSCWRSDDDGYVSCPC